MGGFESILKRMTPSNFNWFIHVMLFLHTLYVIHKQKATGDAENEEEENEDEEDEETEDN